MFGEGGIDGVGDADIPEGVEILAAFGFEIGAHFEPIGLDEIEGAEEAVEAGEDTEVFLGEAKIGFAVLREVEAGVDIAFEGEQGGLGVVGVKGAAPVLVALVVEFGELWAHAHEFREARAGIAAEAGDELF